MLVTLRDQKVNSLVSSFVLLLFNTALILAFFLLIRLPAHVLKLQVLSWER